LLIPVVRCVRRYTTFWLLLFRLRVGLFYDCTVLRLRLIAVVWFTVVDLIYVCRYTLLLRCYVVTLPPALYVCALYVLRCRYVGYVCLLLLYDLLRCVYYALLYVYVLLRGFDWLLLVCSVGYVTVCYVVVYVYAHVAPLRLRLVRSTLLLLRCTLRCSRVVYVHVVVYVATLCLRILPFTLLLPATFTVSRVVVWLLRCYRLLLFTFDVVCGFTLLLLLRC